MHPQEGSIWGNINLCIEIALNIYYIVGERGEGFKIPREYAEETFSEKTVAAGKESDGCLYYPKGEIMDMLLYEMMQKRVRAEREAGQETGLQTGQEARQEGICEEEMYEEEMYEDDYGEQADYGFEA